MRLATSTAAALLFMSSAASALSFNLSQSAQCAPLNVTFAPSRDTSRFPYIVWVSSLFSAAQSFQINSNYQRDANGNITFQYRVPPQSNTFNSFVVTLADAKGDANSSRPLVPLNNLGTPSTCDPYTTSAAFTWASDSLTGSINNMVQCGQIKLYTVDERGTRPFTITFVPLGGTPLTINIPASATPRQSFFNYTATLPYSEGTQFFLVAGDATGATSGGASQLFTVGAATNAAPTAF